MKAIVIKEYGNEDVLEYTGAPRPELKARLIKCYATDLAGTISDTIETSEELAAKSSDKFLD